MTRDTIGYVALAVTVAGLCVAGLTTLGAALACALLTTNLVLHVAYRVWGQDATDA
jgi:hypothetical protein